MNTLSNEQIHEIMAALLTVPTSKVNSISFDKIAKGLGELLARRAAADINLCIGYISKNAVMRMIEGKTRFCSLYPEPEREYKIAVYLDRPFTAPPHLAWISVKDEIPNPEDNRRVCAYTPSEHSDFEYRSVPASLFKAVCSAATHWCYFSSPPEDPKPPAQGEQAVKK